LFRYNVNFNGLKKLLEEINIKTNSNTETINKLNDEIKTKHTFEDFKTHEKLLNSSIKFGLNLQKHVDSEENKFMHFKIDPKDQKTNTEEFAYKLTKLNQTVDFLLLRTAENE
jgi:translation elongation factor EF-1beta